MTILITLTLPPGGDAGPFNLYSNTDGYTIAFASNISASALQAGYTALFVPPGTTTIRVQSVGVCTNFINVPVNVLPTTTTTSSTSTSTTTSTTTAIPTTTTTSSSTSTSTTSTSSSTTTTTTTIACQCYTLTCDGATDTTFEYVACTTGTVTTKVVLADRPFNVCSRSLPIYLSGDPGTVTTAVTDCCIPATTTTSTTPTPGELGLCWSMTWQNDEVPPSTLYARFPTSPGNVQDIRVTNLPKIIGPITTTAYACSYYNGSVAPLCVDYNVVPPTIVACDPYSWFTQFDTCTSSFDCA